MVKIKSFSRVVFGVLALLCMASQANAQSAIDDFESYTVGDLVGQAAAIGTGNWVLADRSIGYGSGNSSPVIVAGIGNPDQGVMGVQTSGCCDTAAAFDLGASLGNGSTVSVEMDNSSGGGDESWLVVGTSSIADDGTGNSNGNELGYAIKMSDYNVAMVYFDGTGGQMQENFISVVGSAGDFVELGLKLSAGANGIDNVEGFYRNVTQGGSITPLVPGSADSKMRPDIIPAHPAGFGTDNTWISTIFFQDFIEDNLRVNNVPEPTSLGILVIGAVALFAFRRGR